MDKRSTSLGQQQQDISLYTDNRPPQYAPSRTGFYCPLSPSILWHHGLVYQECPVDALERDMPECAKCRLRGDAPPYRPKKKPRRRKDNRRPKDNKRGPKDRKKTE